MEERRTVSISLAKDVSKRDVKVETKIELRNFLEKVIQNLLKYADITTEGRERWEKNLKLLELGSSPNNTLSAVWSNLCVLMKRASKAKGLGKDHRQITMACEVV